MFLNTEMMDETKPSAASLAARYGGMTARRPSALASSNWSLSKVTKASDLAARAAATCHRSRAAGHFQAATTRNGLGRAQRVCPVQGFVDERAVVEVLLDVAEDASGVRLGNQAGVGALAHGGAQLESVERGEQGRELLVAAAMAQCCRGMVVRDVERHQEGSVEVGLQSRERLKTSFTPWIGLRERRSSRALIRVADLPRLGTEAEMSLIHGLPPCVTRTTSPEWASSPRDSKPCVASFFDTVFMTGTVLPPQGKVKARQTKPAKKGSRKLGIYQDWRIGYWLP